jgi:hypothetical protein
MAEDNVTNQVEQLSDDELQAHIARLDAFYADQLPRLRTRHEYEKLNCEIEEFQTRKLIAKLRRADLLKPADQSPQSKEEEDESGSTGA